MVRHKKIKDVAELIDFFIDRHNRIRDRKNFPHKKVEFLVRMLFNSKYLGKGWYKTTHLVYSAKKDLAFKFGNKEAIKRDRRLYNKLPKTIRNKHFAKIYWFTKYCMLQKYGIKTKINKIGLLKMKRIGNKYGLRDIKPDNIREVSGNLKIVDATLKGF